MSLLIAILALLTPFVMVAEQNRPSIKCEQLLEGRDWTDPEQFVWSSICAETVADFNDPKRWSGTPSRTPRDPSTQSLWIQEDRKLSSKFLEEILFNEKLNVEIPRLGVVIFGAYFPETIDLSDGSIDFDLCLCMSRFEMSLDVSRIRADRSIILDGSFIKGELNEDGRILGIHAQDIRIGGDLRMRAISVLNAENPNPTFRTMFPTLDLNGAKIEGRLNLDGARVIAFREDDDSPETTLGDVVLDSASIGRDLFIRDALFHAAKIDLVFSEIGANVDLSRSVLNTLDLSGAKVGGELRLAKNKARVRWQKGGKLILRNTTASVLIDAPSQWLRLKGHIDVEHDGFTFQRIGGLGETNARGMFEQDVQNLIDWLRLDESYSPQPYEHLSSLLRSLGASSAADGILFASRIRAREEADDLLDAIWLTMLEYTVGYGIKWYRAIYWVIWLIAIGCVVLFLDQTPCKNVAVFGRHGIGFWFCADYLLPVIRLNDLHFGNLNMGVAARIYFYFHQVLGYVLALFVLAGINELAK